MEKMSEVTKPIRITIIDSGININILNLAPFVQNAISYKLDSRGFIIEDDGTEIKNEHGTVMALIIRNIWPNVQFNSINILNERLTADGRVFIHAFKMALLDKPDILHLSLGTTKWKYKHSLKKLLAKAKESNIIVVAAANNEGIKSYPAYLKGVVGVKAERVNQNHEIYYHKGFYYAPSTPTGIDSINDSFGYKNRAGSSIAAAYVTGHIAKLKNLKDKLNNDQILNELKYISWL